MCIKDLQMFGLETKTAKNQSRDRSRDKTTSRDYITDANKKIKAIRQYCNSLFSDGRIVMFSALNQFIAFVPDN